MIWLNFLIIVLFTSQLFCFFWIIHFKKMFDSQLKLNQDILTITRLLNKYGTNVWSQRDVETIIKNIEEQKTVKDA